MLLALDQSIRVTGYCIFNDDGEIQDYGYWSISPSLAMGQRLMSFWNQLDKYQKAFEITNIAFEDIQMQRGNVETYKRLSYVQAIIILWCEYHNVPYITLSPSHWRSVLKQYFDVTFGRKRQEQKQAAQSFVEQTYNIQATEDEADAISLGTAAILQKNQELGAF